MEQSIHDRLAELKRELDSIRAKDLAYLSHHRQSVATDIEAHEARMMRMKDILDEIAKLMKKS